MEVMHLGVIRNTPIDGETYNEGLKVHITDPDNHPYKFEFLRFEEGSPMHERIQKEPHVAIRVDSIKDSLASASEVLLEETDCGDGLFIAFADVDGLLFEFMEMRGESTKAY